MKNHLAIFCGAFIALCFGNSAQGQGTAFTYQGVLRDGAALANGSYDLRFILFDVEAFGFPVGPIRTNMAVAVSNGLFTVTLDFGPDVFEGSERWLEIGVRPGGAAGGFTTLSPRTRLTPAPYALFAPVAGRAATAATATNALSAGSVPWTGLTGIPAGFADGVDNNSTYTAGAGLTLSGTRFSVAAGGIQTSNLADGAVTALKLAADSVTGGHIQFGAIDTFHLAPGAVGPEALQQPYQSGRVSVENFIPFSSFITRRINHNVVFPTPFSGLPTVTLSLETPHSSAARLIHPIIVRNKTTSGFQLSFPLPNIPITVAQRGSFSLAPLAMVNGQPAMVFADLGLRYLRALDTNGIRWPATSVQITPDNIAEVELLTVNGRPAVAYVDNNSFDIKYVRASDANGATWPPSVNVVTNVSAGDVSIALIAGRPAVVYRDFADGNVWYARALDADGNAWGASSKVDAGHSPDLAEVNSLPGISYDWTNGPPPNSSTYTNQLRFIRGTDANGSAWTASVPVATFGLFQQVLQTQLLIVAGNPAIMFVFNQGGVSSASLPRFARASNNNGTAWNAPVDVSVGGGRFLAGQYTAAMVNGQPAMAWLDSGSGAIVYSVSRDNGASFNTQRAFEYDGRFGLAVSLADVNGFAALTFSDAEETFYLREATPVPDTYINWIAVEP
jgi:hypothetical protein